MPDHTDPQPALDLFEAGSFWRHRSLRDKSIDRDQAEQLVNSLRDRVTVAGGTDKQLADADMHARICAFTSVTPAAAGASFAEFQRRHGS